ncbi:hypothetical protein N7495_001218 [Penicillium taxi]|uniref:uncharacterized protein n=1 Tax=Penicillium taxi TaxID=168475 RepID=UPI002545492D|nr:uncharacterized protein N7495_001218 [Penicillium taxi]KAJ5908536.1 hypothetical protein N7495_001218 [Penicillium taxi]
MPNWTNQNASITSSFDDNASEVARNFGANVEDDGLDGSYDMTADTDNSDEVDYYTLLGLSSKPAPTDSEIRSAYRTLSLSFHPDKQPPHLRHAAEEQFRRIQEAYDTLIDNKKRTVYDLLGAEGVRREWSAAGAMGVRGEAQRQHIGIKAMSPDEFRRWFVKRMKTRERKAVESMVSSKGTITIMLNASNTIDVDEDRDVTLHIPRPKLQTFGAAYQFKVPLPLPEFLHATKKLEDNDQSEMNETEEEDDPIQVTFNAGIVGNVRPTAHKYIVEREDGSETEELIPGPPLLASQNITLGATVTPNIQGLAGIKGIWHKRPLSFLKDSQISFNLTALPAPALQTTFYRAFQPAPGIKPIQVKAVTTIKHSLLELPPSIELQATKEVAKGKIGFIQWSSGSFGWPDLLLDRFRFLGMSSATFFAAEDDGSSLQVGLISMPSQPALVVDTDVDDDDDEDGENAEHLRELEKKKQAIDRSAASFRTHLHVSPEGGGFVLMYGRNVFSGTPADDPVKSEWSSEGYYPMPRMESERAVRIEFTSVISLGQSPSWSVKGTRRVGEYTKVGLGVGFAGNGITMNIHWSRLGQRISLPIVLCPADKAVHEAAVLGAVIPWLAYCAFEFGYIRPSNRKKRRQLAARRHNELKKLIPLKREEALQATELMVDQVQRRQDREMLQSGFVVTRAEYGFYPPKNKKAKPGFNEPRVIDVTVPVAALVDRGQLIIPQNTVKFQILGFYDPAPLLPKRLKIWYTFQGREHYVEVGDKEGAACPMRTHTTSS